MEEQNKPLSADGWIEWKGGECPVAFDTIVEVRLRNGLCYLGPAMDFYHLWPDDNTAMDVVAYRVTAKADDAYYAELERKHFGDPDQGTGIYAKSDLATCSGPDGMTEFERGIVRLLAKELAKADDVEESNWLADLATVVQPEDIGGIAIPDDEAAAILERAAKHLGRSADSSAVAIRERSIVEVAAAAMAAWEPATTAKPPIPGLLIERDLNGQVSPRFGSASF